MGRTHTHPHQMGRVTMNLYGTAIIYMVQPAYLPTFANISLLTHVSSLHLLQRISSLVSQITMPAPFPTLPKLMLEEAWKKVHGDKTFTSISLTVLMPVYRELSKQPECKAHDSPTLASLPSSRQANQNALYVHMRNWASK